LRESSSRRVGESTEYATRLRGGQYSGLPQDDGLAGIAVLLRDGAHAQCTINILWVRTVLTVEKFANRHVADLQDASAREVSSLQWPSKYSIGTVSG